MVMGGGGGDVEKEPDSAAIASGGATPSVHKESQKEPKRGPDRQLFRISRIQPSVEKKKDRESVISRATAHDRASYSGKKGERK